jgi:thioesterase domain-containing protein/acyl carrier protein
VLSATRPQRLLNVYGPTETTTFATFHVIERVDGPRIPIGRPIANTNAWILDEAFAPVPVGTTGELFLGGPGLALGYRGAPELTAKRFVETPFGRLYRTGDLACWLPDGSIDCLGRADDQIKVRGFRVEPGEIEAVLRQQPGVKDCHVVAVQPASQPKQLIAYFTSNGSKAKPAALQTALARVLPGYMMPAAFVPVTAFPLTANGKLDLRALPSPDSAAISDLPMSPGPRNGTERDVAAVWSELLGRERIGVTDDFFLLGGHSLLAIRMIAALRERFGVELPVRRLFEAPTVEAIAEFIATVRPPAREMPSLVPLQRGESGERPFFLVPGGWGGEIEFFIYTHIIRHIGADLPIFGLRARGADGMHEPHGSVQEMAADYVGEIRTQQPRGPYLIGGECIGGIVAYEMARQIEAQGEKVDLLALLDTDVPTRTSFKEFVTYERSERLRNFWEVHVAQPARGHLEKIAPLSLTEKWQYLLDRTVRRGSRELADEPDMADRKLLADYPRILLSHRLQPYRGKVTLLIDEASHRQFGNLGWDDVKTGGLAVHVLPGDHLSYIRANAKVAAAKLRELIEQTKQAATVC